MYAFLRRSILGSRLNIPIWRLHDRFEVLPMDAWAFGILYRASEAVRTP